MQMIQLLVKKQLTWNAVCPARSKYSIPTQDRCCAHVKVHCKSDATMPGPSGILPLEYLVEHEF